ncbi:M48 family metalloprotease, partial [Methylobacterium goesingense]
MLLPLAFVLLGLWEGRRAEDDRAAFAAEQARLSAIVADLAARAPQDGRVDFRLQFRQGGQVYGGPLALDKARAAESQAATLTTLMDWRRLLPPVVVAGGGLAALLSVLVLLAGAALGWVGRSSRDALVRGFSLVRRLLPATLALQILAAATATVAAVIFEAGLLAQSGLSGDAMKLLGIAAVAVGAILWAAGRTVLGLRRALAAFEPDPLPIFGRRVSPAEAPGLWRLTEGLAERLGALKPEAVVVGLTGGFFVSAGPAVLEPGGERLTGRILYLPLPYLALMRGDEVAAIIGHELAHYAGGDTAYSQRFLPIYAGVGRSLDAVAAGHQGSLGLLGPSLRLGLFVMERFHLAVRHWSRAREFAADAAGAGLTTPEAAARALLRTGA